jgi:hypothetical protein
MAHCKTSFESREALNVNGTRLSGKYGAGVAWWIVTELNYL